MKKLSILTLTIIGTAGIVWAVSAHLKGRNPVLFVDNGLTLTATVSYAGLGNFDTLQGLNATADPTATCSNKGQNQPPGQNPAEVDVTGSTAVPVGDIDNGNVSIATTTNPPVTPVPAAPDCPNAQNWSENITDMAFTSATITLFQDSNENGTFEDGELVLTVTCTFNSPTSNGPVPRSGFTCSENALTEAPAPGTQSLTVNNGRGGGNYAPGTMVKVTADTPPPEMEFAGWSDDIQCLANPFISPTTATTLSRPVTITATYKKK